MRQRHSRFFRALSSAAAVPRALRFKIRAGTPVPAVCENAIKKGISLTSAQANMTPRARMCAPPRNPRAGQLFLSKTFLIGPTAQLRHWSICCIGPTNVDMAAAACQKLSNVA
jgi:hypothetical protein